MQHSKGITVGTYVVQRKRLIAFLSVQLVRNVKIGKSVAIEKSFLNALYVRIVQMLVNVTCFISQLAQKQY